MIDLTKEEFTDILKAFGEDLRKGLNVRFDAIDQRFEAIDQRFEVIDQRFEAVDRRFDHLEEEVGEIKRIVKMIDAKSASYERRFEKIGRAVFDTG